MNTAPPKLSRANNTRFAVIVIAMTVAGASAMVYFFNPIAHHFYPVCQFHRLTGLNCPGCGGTRSLYALLHGDISTAVRDNALFIAALVAVICRGGWFAVNHLRGKQNGKFFPPTYLIPVLIIMGVFGVVRNLPFCSSFLSP